MDFPGGSDGKASACNAGDRGSIPGLGKIPWRRKQQPTPVLLPGKSPWTEESGRLQSIKSQTQLGDFTFFSFFIPLVRQRSPLFCWDKVLHVCLWKWRLENSLSIIHPGLPVQEDHSSNSVTHCLLQQLITAPGRLHSPCTFL